MAGVEGARRTHWGGSRARSDPPRRTFDAMSIIFIRHGETALNTARVIQPADTPLSDRGRQQARAVARRVAALQPAAVWSSDLPRALETAQAVAAASAGVPLTTSELLRERNFGDLRGRRYDELDFDPLRFYSAPPNGESVDEFRERVAQAFAEAVRLRAALPGPLAVVSHGLVLRTIIGAQLTVAPDAVSQLVMGNTSVTIVAAEAPHAIEVLDCILHLDSAATAHDSQSLSGG